MSDIERIIIDIVKNSYQTKMEIDSTTKFDDIDRSSMKLIAVLAHIENKLDIEISLSDAMNMKTVGDLINRVSSKQKE